MTCTERESNGGGGLALEREVAHFLATGESDPLGSAFPGGNILERVTNYERHLREGVQTLLRYYVSMVGPAGFEPATKRL
jgi:hypothetical protein